MAEVAGVDPRELEELAIEVARLAGAQLALAALERDHLGEHARQKSSATDLVTEADIAAEGLVVEALLGARPGDAVLGEEGASRAGSSGITWVIDPLDGTTNFVYGYGSFAVSIAARTEEATLAGVVFDPVRNELFSAALGSGARKDGLALVRPAPSSLDHALVGTGFGYLAERRAAQAGLLPALLPAVRDIRRSGTAALDLCSVALGRLDAYYEAGLAPWDKAAGLLICREAGCETLELELDGVTGATTVAAPADLIGPFCGLLRDAARRALPASRA